VAGTRNRNLTHRGRWGQLRPSTWSHFGSSFPLKVIVAESAITPLLDAWVAEELSPSPPRPARRTTRRRGQLHRSDTARARAPSNPTARQLAHMIRKLHGGLLRTSQHSRGCRTECLESVARALSGECGSVCLHSVSEPVLSGDRERRVADHGARGGCGERARGVTARQVPSAPTSAGRPTTLSNHDSGGSKVPKGTPGDV
jgi:hypothetical protein